MPAASASEAQLLTPWLRWAPRYSPARGTSRGTPRTGKHLCGTCSCCGSCPPPGRTAPSRRASRLPALASGPVHAPHVCPPVRPGRVVAVPDDDLVPSHFCRDLVEDPVELPLPAPGAGAGDDDNTRVSH